jgi:hypothetical protein
MSSTIKFLTWPDDLSAPALPVGSFALSAAHVPTTVLKPMSFPPMPMVTSVVPAVTASNCGAFDPWDCHISSVFAATTTYIGDGAGTQSLCHDGRIVVARPGTFGIRLDGDARSGGVRVAQRDVVDRLAGCRPRDDSSGRNC